MQVSKTKQWAVQQFSDYLIQWSVTYLHEGANQCGKTPKENACGHDDPPVVPVSEVAEERSKDHVADDEHRLQETLHVVR